MDPITFAVTGFIGMFSLWMAVQPQSNDEVWGALGIVVWATFGLGATNVEVMRDSTTYIRSYPGLAVVGAACVVISLIILFYGSLKLFRREEVEEAPDRVV